MNLELAHIVLNVADVSRSKEFYAEKLGLELIEEHPKSFAVRAGHVRITVSPGGEDSDADSGVTVIFRVDDIDDAVSSLKEKGVRFSGEVLEAPGFMRFVSFEDPDGNQLMLGQYARDPLEKV